MGCPGTVSTDGSAVAEPKEKVPAGVLEVHPDIGVDETGGKEDL